MERFLPTLANENFQEPTKSLVQGLHGSYKCGLIGLKAVSQSPFKIPGQKNADFKKVQKFRKFDPDIKLTASSILGIFEIGFINPFLTSLFKLTYLFRLI